MLKIETEEGGENMAKPKYKKKYADDLLTYFFKFIDMRDNPREETVFDNHGLYLMEPGVDDVYRALPPKPATGYPTLTKFAIMKGVTPRTITNWRKKYKEFDEACEFADAVQDDILNERALTGDVDGRVAMKIRELKAAAKKEATQESGSRLVLTFAEDGSDQKIEIKKWVGEINEDTEY